MMRHVSQLCPREGITFLLLKVLVMTLVWQCLANPCSPNLCSGHGSCESGTPTGTAVECSCFSGWQGADCSFKICPFGAAWSDVAAAIDDAHNAAECSNMGLCDRRRGECVCHSGFEGQACERKSCPMSCSGHGRCQGMSYFASMKDSGEGPVYTYSQGWDATKIQGCSCDEGYWGYDCALRHCATGDDPLTGTEEDPDGEQANEMQQIVCKATGGSFTLAFRGYTTTEVPYDASAAAVVKALKNLPSIYSEYDDAISIQYAASTTQACTSSGHTFTVEFLQNFGDLPMLVAETSKLRHSSTGVSPSVTIIEEIQGTKENEYCSNRGLCDYSNGICSCEPELDTSNGYNEKGTRGDCGYVESSVTHCPGEVSCSGHGVCSGSPTYACDCSDGWQGSDCSLKTCSKGKSWFSLPTANEKAHLSYAECSDMGVCDRITGECVCASGFEGGACDRMSCPGSSLDSSCNGHGQCMSMAQLAEHADANGDSTDYTYGATPNSANTWDHDMIYGCFCDEGYFGYDCSLRSCPYGDDPDTLSQHNEIQTIVCTDADQTGVLVFTFRQQETTTLSPVSSAAELGSALENLSSLINIAVTCDNSYICAATGSTCTVEFYTELGDVPLIQVSQASITSVTVTESTKGTKEYDECSHKGLCDYKTALCSCFHGYGSSNGQNGQGALGDCGFRTPIAAAS